MRQRFLRRGGAVATLAALLLLVLLPTGAAADPGTGRPASVGAPAAAPAASTSSAAADLCARVGYAAGFRGQRLATAVAVALAESDCTIGATSYNGPTSGCPYGSADRGLWQINDCYHDEVSDTCAYAAQCNADAAYTISSHGADWTPWTTYDTGAYTGRLAEARAAVARLGTGGAVTGTVSTDGPPLTVRAGPGTGYTAVGSVTDGTVITIVCQTRGQTITGPWGPTNLWDKLGSGRYVTDAYVYTGSNGQVAPTC